MTQLWKRLTPLYEPREAQAIVRLLLEDAFGLTLTDIVGGAIDRMTDSQQKELEAMMRCLEDGEPVQYVLGYADFYGRRFKVSPAVLIPRPETAELCGMISAWADSRNLADGSRVLDACTGSGCIAITLKLNCPQLAVSAYDISEDALDVARENAARLGAEVSFFKHDALSESTSPVDRKYSLIVSNPPYIADSEREYMDRNVLAYEPRQALFVPDSEPLKFYKAIAAGAARQLVGGGMLAFEINPEYSSEMVEMLAQTGFDGIKTVKDQFGKERFALGIQP